MVYNMTSKGQVQKMTSGLGHDLTSGQGHGLTSGQGHDMTKIGHVAYHSIRIDETGDKHDKCRTESPSLFN